MVDKASDRRVAQRDRDRRRRPAAFLDRRSAGRPALLWHGFLSAAYAGRDVAPDHRTDRPGQWRRRLRVGVMSLVALVTGASSGFGQMIEAKPLFGLRAAIRAP
ncbi:hypothetical protein [Methylobacterium sp. sgz302541]|uniref:hypothetical protein n=1 Tax=unclassified Methylobacterium TaxID=2615210 RepID=UPI003D33612F